MIFTIALQSLKSRRGAVLLTMLSVILSVGLLVATEHIRLQAKDSFGRTISGTDLIVGPRTGQTNLLLYSVFRVGNPTNNISWASVESIQNYPGVNWAVPISLGDSHKGFAVVGTTSDYFRFFQYGNKQALQFKEGQAFDSVFGAVIGSDVAKTMRYKVGDEIVLSHGMAEVSFKTHQHSPFRVTGILLPTGTPVDKTVHVSLQGLEAAHMSQHQLHELEHDLQEGEEITLPIEQVTAVLVGLDSPIRTLQIQRQINQSALEPMMAILPGVALSELWQLVGNIENLLLLISVMILFASLLGLATMLLTSIRERRREIAVLRAIGASPVVVFLLIQTEAFLISVSASIIAVLLVWGTLIIGANWLSEEYGLFVDANLFTLGTFTVVGLVCVITFIIACVPAITAYKQTLQQGLNAR
ncbi:ABC transporter permease [Aliiglaciecola sp. M165]|uniref:ABC transporter permease n=1 Tax=Aliiglaciecola sp. M165 TaxID=2593649 RepID=UPI00117DB1EA|nr:ABC transporter permease [Aliiglaciecola sp. M165]TRY29880.1 ABC transporter permease [Aliiglaciecola sp. M165]